MDRTKDDNGEYFNDAEQAVIRSNVREAHAAASALVKERGHGLNPRIAAHRESSKAPVADRSRVGEIYSGAQTGMQWVVSDVDSAGEPREYASDAHTMCVFYEGRGKWGIVTNNGAFLRRPTDALGRRGHTIKFSDLAEAMAFTETQPVDASHMARYGGGLMNHLKSKVHEAPSPENELPKP